MLKRKLLSLYNSQNLPDDDMQLDKVVASDESSATPIKFNELMGISNEMHTTILEQCNVASLISMRRASKHWYDLATIELFKRRSPQAIAAQKFLLKKNLSLYFSNPHDESRFFKIKYIPLHSLYFTKNHHSSDSVLRALTAAALLVLDTYNAHTLTAPEKAQLKHDILLTTLDPSAYQHTLLAFMISPGKEQFLASAITGIKNLLATCELATDDSDIDNDDGFRSEQEVDRIEYLQKSAYPLLQHLGAHLDQEQLADLIAHFTTMLTEENEYYCRIACEAFEAIGAHIPDAMIGPIVHTLIAELLNLEKDDIYQETLHAICFFMPRLSSAEFKKIIVIFQEYWSTGIIQEALEGEPIYTYPQPTFNSVSAIMDVASQQQLQDAVDVLEPLLFDAIAIIDSVQNAYTRAEGCTLLRKLINGTLFSSEQCDAFVHKLIDIVSNPANNAIDPASLALNAIYNTLAASAGIVSLELFEKIMSIFIAMMDSELYKVTAARGLQQLAPRMSPEQRYEIISAYELKLADYNNDKEYMDAIIMAIYKLASYLPKQALATMLGTLQNELVNSETQTPLMICKRLNAMVSHTPVEQRVALSDAVIRMMTHPDFDVRIFAMRSAAIISSLFSGEELQPTINAFVERLSDNYTPIKTMALKTFTGLVSQLSSQQLVTIIPHILAQLINESDSVSEAAAAFFLAIAQRDATHLLSVHQQLLESSIRYSVRRNGDQHLSPTSDNQAHQAFIAVLPHCTNLQLTGFINELIDVLAIETPEGEIPNAAAREQIVKTLVMLDALMSFVKSVPEIPSLDQLMNAFITKLYANNYWEISSVTESAFRDLILHLPDDTLPLYIPLFLDLATGPIGLTFTKIIIELVPRLTNDNLRHLIAPLRTKFQHALLNDASIAPEMCNALFAIKYRLPDEAVWFTDMWTHPNHRNKFPLLFQLVFNHYQQAVNELTPLQNTAAAKRRKFDS